MSVSIVHAPECNHVSMYFSGAALQTDGGPSQSIAVDRARGLSAMRYSILDLSAFLVVVPCGNQQERHFVVLIMLAKDPKCIFKGLSATPVHVPVQAPGGLGVIESGPNRPHHQFVRMAVLHPPEKIVQILLAPVASIRCPTLRPRMHPGVLTVEILFELCRRLILINQDRRFVPGVQYFADVVPVGIPSFGEDEEHRSILIKQIRVVPWRVRSDIILVGFIKCFER